MSNTQTSARNGPGSSSLYRWRFNIGALIVAIPLLAFWFGAISNSATIAGAVGAGLAFASTNNSSTRTLSFWRLMISELPKPVLLMTLFMLSIEKSATFAQWEPTNFQSSLWPQGIWFTVWMLATGTIGWFQGPSSGDAVGGQ